MKDKTPAKDAWRDRIRNHVEILLLGLVVVLLPIVVLSKSVEHAQKAVQKALTTVAPGVQALGAAGLTLGIVLLLLLACWFLGWLVSRTVPGQRLLAWEKSKFLGRSPKLQKRVAAKAEAEAGVPPPKEAQPALAHVAGGWQPGVLVEERADGWATVFLPDVPSLETGRLYCLSGDQVLRLDVPLDAYREKLKARGRDTSDWLRALSEKGADPGPAKA